MSRKSFTAMERELRRRQSNLLPLDVLANNKLVDDVLWHGARRGSTIQRVGALVIGVTLICCCLATGSILYRAGARLWLAPLVVIAAGAVRIIYKGAKGRP